jgi:hypothetical protein
MRSLRKPASKPASNSVVRSGPRFRFPGVSARTPDSSSPVVKGAKVRNLSKAPGAFPPVPTAARRRRLLKTAGSQLSSETSQEMLALGYTWKP